MKAIISTIKHYWLMLPDSVKRIWHTAWVTFAVTFGAGLLPIVNTYLTDNNLHGAVTALGALALAALLAVGTAIRLAIVKALTPKAK